MWLGEYEQLLRDAAEGAFQAAVELKARHRPPSLFKYRSVTDEALDSLRRGYVWLSHPTSFNDGYDSALFVNHDRLLATSMRRSLRANIERYGLSRLLSEADIRAIEDSDDPARTLGLAVLTRDPEFAGIDRTDLLDALASAMRQQTKDLEQATREMARASIVVCSFATSGTTPALWAHYAGNGSGFCIEYEVKQLPPDDIRLRLLHPVIYGPAPFDSTFLFEHFMVNGLSALTVRWPLLAATYKDRHWSYEQEWRLIDPAGSRANGRAVPLPIKAVYLGTATSPDSAARVIRAAEPHRVPILKMQVGRDASTLACSVGR